MGFSQAPLRLDVHRTPDPAKFTNRTSRKRNRKEILVRFMDSALLPRMNTPAIQASIKAEADKLFAAAKKLMEAHAILGNDEAQPLPAVPNGKTAPRPVVDGAGKTLSRANVFYDVLKAHGSKMERSKILEVARTNGSEISKPDTASVYMKQDIRFRRIGRGFWGLSEWDKKE